MRLALVLSLFAALLPVAAVASSNTAHIGFASISPVSVRGTGFVSGERVDRELARSVPGQVQRLLDP